MDFEGDWKECYPISATVEALLSLHESPGVSFAELLHYSWCTFNSISLADSNDQYQPFATTLFPLLLQEFSLGTLAGKSACIAVAWYYVRWGAIEEAIKILKQIFGQDFGFVLWLAQLKDNVRVVLDRPGWNEKQSFNFGPHWNFKIIPRIQYQKAVTILRWIRDHDTRSWDSMLVEESSHDFSDHCFSQRLNHGFDVRMMRPESLPKSASEARS